MLVVVFHRNVIGQRDLHCEADVSVHDETDFHCCETLRCVQCATQRHECWHTDRADVEDGRSLEHAGLNVLDSDEGANVVPWIITQWRSSVRKES